MPVIPSVAHDEVLGFLSPSAAIDAVARGFEAHARGEWRMPSKVYLESPPFGDFRAMPALGDGLAILKWVTSFPGNPARGLPTVTGAILVNDASTGEPLALIDARSITALRTGAAAAVATRALASSTALTAGIVGCGLHGAWAARCLAAAGLVHGVCHDPDRDAAEALAAELGWDVGDRGAALACDVVTTVTPGNEPVIGESELHPGLHVNALGADGPGKAELSLEAIVRCELFCDEWDQASHGGELAGAVESGRVVRADVTELGAVLTGSAPGRSSDEAVTLFDSTGLAIQDLALARLVMDGLGSGEISAARVQL